MPSTVQVKEKTVNNRDVISFSKEYSGETHEVFAPKEQATQVLLNILTVANKDKADPEQLVLARKGDIGGDVETVNGEMLKETVAMSVIESLYDEHAAREVTKFLNGDTDV